MICVVRDLAYRALAVGRGGCDVSAGSLRVREGLLIRKVERFGSQRFYLGWVSGVNDVCFFCFVNDGSADCGKGVFRRFQDANSHCGCDFRVCDVFFRCGVGFAYFASERFVDLQSVPRM